MEFPTDPRIHAVTSPEIQASMDSIFPLIYQAGVGKITFEQLKTALGGLSQADIDAITPEVIGAALAAHQHVIAELSDFPTTMPPDAHQHVISELSDFPTTMPPDAHQHVISELSDFPATMPPDAHQHVISELSDFPTTMPPDAHQHLAEDITDLTGNTLYCLEGNGTVTMAQTGSYYAKEDDYNADIFTILVVGTFFSPADEIILRRCVSTDDSIILEFGRDNTDHLYLDISDGTTVTKYTSQSGLFQYSVPVEIGCQINKTLNTITFFGLGGCESTQVGGGELFSPVATEYLELGVGAIFDFYWAAICRTEIKTPGTKQTPYPLDGRLALPPGVVSLFVTKNDELYLPDIISARDMNINCPVTASIR